MILFKRSEQVSLRAIKLLVGYLIINLLVGGAVVRLFINKKFSSDFILTRDFLREFDQLLLMTFWLMFAVGLGFAVYFVKAYFSPLGILIDKARSIKKGSLSVRKTSVIKESRGEWYQLDLLLNKISRDLKRKKADVVKERSELEAVITAASDAILAVDRDMNIKYYNGPMALMFDQNDEASWGKKLTEVVRDQKIISAFQKAIEEQRVQAVETQQTLTVDSTPHHYTVSISPFMDEKKKRPRGAVAIFHDITDLKKVEKVRMDFVANASHELKTPLTSVQGYISLLREHVADNPQTQESFKVINGNLHRLNQIITDLLDLSRIESTDSVPLSSISTMELTEEVVGQLSGLFKEKQQDLILTYDIKTVNANGDLLVHVLSNLLENAIKYSPEQSMIKIRWGESGGQPYLSVKDNGVGIESFHQARLFERFYRVRDEQNYDKKGTGLGLAIVRHCMEKMQGHVDVKSAPSLGSEFICYFKN